MAVKKENTGWYPSEADKLVHPYLHVMLTMNVSLSEKQFVGATEVKLKQGSGISYHILNMLFKVDLVALVWYIPKKHGSGITIGTM